jgi:hypothetical protein
MYRVFLSTHFPLSRARFSKKAFQRWEVFVSRAFFREWTVADFTPMSRAFLMFTLVAHVLTAEVDVERFFRVEQHLQPNDLDAAPIRSVVTLSPEAAVVAWTVAPGQRLLTHRHPRGQDTCAAPLLSRSYVLLTNINCPSMTGGQCSRVGASTLSMRRAQRVPSKQVTLSSLGRAMCMAC